MFNLNIYTEPETERSPIFKNSQTSIKYLILTNRLSSEISCKKCNKIMRIISSKAHLNTCVYSCINRQCRKQIALFDLFIIQSPKIQIELYLLAIYKWIENVYEKDILRNLKISKFSYQLIKKHILKFIELEREIEENKLLGSNGMKVQVDETVICHGFLLKSPSNLDDETPGLTWLVGIIEEQSWKVRFEIVPNRKAETFKDLFRRNIAPNAVIVTDGHKSYPSAVSHINGHHIIVNHSIGFKNIDGFHTNNIENLWSLLKYEIKRRRGVISTNIPQFLNEFWFRYTRIRTRTRNEVFNAWNSVVDYLFTKK